MKRILLTIALSLGLSSCVTLGPRPAGGYSFAVIGDTPYSDSEREHFPLLMERIDSEELAFVAHVGDIKSDTRVCSDEILLDRYRLFQKSRHPFIYVPGDNEWTDCRSGYDPVERLQKLREIFFRDDQTLGERKFKLERQSANPAFRQYRENVRWRIGRVLFVALNIPGSENNFGDGLEPSPEFVERRRANQAWLAEAFALAGAQRMAGIVIVIQANPDIGAANAGHPNRGYGEFMEQLRAETLAFDGQVLLVHGDTHWHHIDQPLLHPRTREPIRNFIRLETYGSPFMGFVKVKVDDNDPKLFGFESRPYDP
ncbi:MAG: hypothetical protein HYS14_05360 [Candidatus Rokubacteria bacterium]|nr:hypothetical protein [Candidatus Rokubacteria bacterium]MBI3456583.1 hypothetical protein [Candidatus Rokubacteria bacterium]